MARKTLGVTIRAYVVGFGDCILARIPDGTKTRHVLVDFGRAPGQGASGEQFEAIAQDIHEFCGGHLDLLVMTHEHLDHLEGFLREKEVFDQIEVDHVWMGLPSSPTYYSDYPDARQQKRLMELAASLADGRGIRALTPQVRTLLENNVSNADRLAYLRNMKKRGAKVHYLARGVVPKGCSPFKAVKVDVLAPEEDVSVYYPASRVSSVVEVAKVADGGGEDDWWSFSEVEKLEAPKNLSESDWTRLHEAIQGGNLRAARFIDKAQNNTSLCFQLTVGGRRLLFTGDAEIESWEVMLEKHDEGVLGPVDFLKVSHHGSRNGTPDDALDRLLPRSRKDRAKALVSTRSGTYGTANPVPDRDVLAELRKRCAEVYNTDGSGGLYVQLTL
ncbi:MAG: hypothetical protein QM765_41510 [Myxococcales bacterium]